MEAGTPNLATQKRMLGETTIYLEDDELENRAQEQSALVGKIITDRPLNRRAV